MAVTGRSGKIAVVDVGSNSIRLVVYDSLGRSPTPVFNEKASCALGRDIRRTNRLSTEGRKKAILALIRFKGLISQMGIARIEVIATAAIRDAEDGPDFVEEAKVHTGFDIQVISGSEEARLAAMGVLSGTPWADGVVGDLGGGSLELVGVDDGVIKEQSTLPLGIFRVNDFPDYALLQSSHRSSTR